MSVKIVFFDAPEEANEGATVTTTGEYYYSSPELLPQGTNPGAIATGELNSWGLTHDFKVWDVQPLAFWSNDLSGNDCRFNTPPTITVTLDSQYSASGITFRFAPSVNEYCPRIAVEWYRGGVAIDSGEYFPSSAEFVLDNLVEGFDGIRVTLKETNLPNRRAKLESLGIGSVREYGDGDIIDITVDRETDITSLTLPISAMDVKFKTPKHTGLYFFKRQSVDVYLDGEIEGRFFVGSGRRIGATTYQITATDMIGETEQFRGQTWLPGTVGSEPIEDQLNRVAYGKGFEFELSDDLKLVQTEKHTTAGLNVRNIVQQIAFGANAFVSTAGTVNIKLATLESESFKKIDSRDIYSGGSIENSDYITSLTLWGYKVVHEYEDYNVLIPVDASDETALLHLNGTSVTIKNPAAEAERENNVIEIKNAYYLESEELNKRAEELYKYYSRRRIYIFKHVVRGERVGDAVEVSLPWGGTARGHIIKMKISSSGLTVSDTELLLDEEV